MQASKINLTAGDVVRLKSSSPLMTIGFIDRDELKCFWADQEEAIRVFDMQGFLPNPLILERQEPAPTDQQTSVQPGQRVQLRSSSAPVMTVNAVRKNSVYQYLEAECVWFNSAQMPMSKVLPVKVLKSVD
jgi:uncharacterized protein YodC (DUF2158 family)